MAVEWQSSAEFIAVVVWGFSAMPSNVSGAAADKRYVCVRAGSRYTSYDQTETNLAFHHEFAHLPTNLLRE